MPRGPRKVSASGLYHIVMRGNGKQLIFEDDGDREAFLQLLKRFLPEAKLVMIAWCLMENHVHLCLRDDGDDLTALSRAMQALQTRYAQLYNAKTGHVGHVFQGRFGSFPIEDERYLLEAVRYIHANPEKAGICAAHAYRWSSYSEYVGTPVLCDTAPVLEALGGADGFTEFMATQPPVAYRPPTDRRTRMGDDEAPAFAQALVNAWCGCSLQDVKGLARPQRDEVLTRLRKEGLSVRQLERLTGIGKYAITNATKTSHKGTDTF